MADNLRDDAVIQSKAEFAGHEIKLSTLVGAAALLTCRQGNWTGNVNGVVQNQK